MIQDNHIGEIRPVDAMIYAIEMVNGVGLISENWRRGIDASWKYARPGAVIERMPQEWREKLANLKSEDFDKMGFDKYYDDLKWYGKLSYSEMLMKLDKKLWIKINS